MKQKSKLLLSEDYDLFFLRDLKHRLTMMLRDVKKREKILVKDIKFAKGKIPTQEQVKKTLEFYETIHKGEV